MLGKNVMVMLKEKSAKEPPSEGKWRRKIGQLEHAMCADSE